jgi:hypothetical protein
MSIVTGREFLPVGKGKNLTGQKFGRLTAIGVIEKGADGGNKWLCQCECSNIVAIYGRLLTSQKSPSCGCARKAKLTGEKFGKLTAIRIISTDSKSGNKWLCYCDCGGQCTPLANALMQGKTRSCGCLGKIGVLNWRLRNTWGHMIRRCHDPLHKQAGRYGKRGIRVCDEWQSFKAFESWALNHPDYTDKMTIERIDVNKGYSPGNCTWIPRSEQNKNKECTIRLLAWGEEKTLLEWMNDPRCVAKYVTVLYRLKKGCPPELALSTKGRINRL